MENSDIVVKFKCEQCREMKNTISWKDVKPNPGKLCDSCWGVYTRRMMQLI